MSIRHSFQTLMLSGIVALGSVLLMTADAVDWEGDFQAGSQSHRSDSLNADGPTLSADLSLSQMSIASLMADLRFSTREDLYDRVITSRLGLSGKSSRLSGNLLFGMAQRDPGELSLPIFRFDPEAMLIIEEREQSSQILDMNADAVWLADFFSLSFDLDASRLSYPEPDSVISDRRDRVLGTKLSLYLPGSLELNLLMDLTELAYVQRPASDRRGTDWELRLSRFLGDQWSLQASAEIERQKVENAAGLNSYEKPGGTIWSLGATADRYSSQSDFSMRADWSRENWDEYDGYYRPGDAWMGEMMISRSLPLGVRMEILGGLSGFDPDSTSSELWTLDRSRERRMEGSLQIGLFGDRSTPMELTFYGEESRLGVSGADRFRILQAQLGIRWNWSPGRNLSGRISLDEYQSVYEGEDSQRDLGSSGQLGLQWKWKSSWTITLDAVRSRRFSFLDEGELIEDWEVSLGLRKVPESGFRW